MGCLFAKSIPIPTAKPKPALATPQITINEKEIQLMNEVKDIKASFESLKESFDDEKKKYQDSVKKMLEDFEHYKLSTQELLDDKHHEIKSLKSRLRHHSLKNN